MFNQQPPGLRRPLGTMPGPPLQCQNDIQAKEKLATVIYEYLSLSGATKSAEQFKEEILSNYPSSAVFKPAESGPGFLQSWWLLFWDLYCAAPERREMEGSSLEAKHFYDSFVAPGYGPGPVMNGMHMFPGGPPMGMPGPDGMMGGFPRFPPGRPGGPIPAGYGGMFPGGPGDPRAMPGQRMVPSNAARMMGGMRFGGPGGFMDSPGQAFPPSAMIPNGMGSQVPMSMSSPGMPPQSEQQYMMSMPPNSSSMAYGMDGPPGSMSGPGSGGLGQGGPGGPEAMQLGGMNGECPSTTEMKQSPASTPRGVNGGTPAPGSAQSGHASGGTPGANPDGDKIQTPGSSKPEDMDEISKIKQGLMEDFTPGKEEPMPAAGGGASDVPATGFYHQ